MHVSIRIMADTCFWEVLWCFGKLHPSLSVRSIYVQVCLPSWLLSPGSTTMSSFLSCTMPGT